MINPEQSKENFTYFIFTGGWLYVIINAADNRINAVAAASGVGRIIFVMNWRQNLCVFTDSTILQNH